MNKNLLIISNIVHSSPRLTGIFYYLSKEEWNITIITPKLSHKKFSQLNLPINFKKKVTLLFTDKYDDIFEPIRRLMYKLKIISLNKNEGFTENLVNKTSLNNLIPGKFYSFWLRFYQTFFGFPDTEKKWYNVALPIARDFCQKNNVLIVFSSSPYPTCHIIAKKLVQIFNLKWVADFRDPWSQNHNYQMFFFRKILDRYYEIKTLRKADLIITASEGFKKKLKIIHKAPIEVISNGYFPLKIVNKNKLNKKLTLLYTGKIYEGKQNPIPLLKAIKKFNETFPSNSGEIIFKIYGPFSSNVQNLIKELQLSHCVKQKGPISRKNILLEHQKANALILFNWTSYEEGIFPLKFYEYLASKKTILTIGKDYSEEINNILKLTNSGVNLINENDVYSKICYMHKQLKLKRNIEKKYNFKNVEKYSIQNSSFKLNNILHNLLNDK